MAEARIMYVVQSQHQNGGWVDVAGAVDELVAVNLMTQKWGSTGAMRVVEQETGNLRAWIGSPIETPARVTYDELPA